MCDTYFDAGKVFSSLSSNWVFTCSNKKTRQIDFQKMLDFGEYRPKLGVIAYFGLFVLKLDLIVI